MRKPNRSGLSSLTIPLLLGASLVFLLTRDALSWADRGHESVTETAIGVLSKMLNDKLDRKYLALLPQNVLEPDALRVVDHTDVKDCGKMIDKLANKAERLLHKNEDWSKIMFFMGEATHYVEDLNNPYHCGGDDEEHEKFEKIAISGRWGSEDYDGFHYIRDYRIFAENICRSSRRYLKFTDQLLQEYDPDSYKTLIAPIWKHSVNDVLDLWLTILWNGLGKDYKTFGLPEPKGIRDDKDIKFEKIKDLK